jgi:hypothetical protein
MSLKEGIFASPFTSTDDEIDPTTEKAKEVLAQPPATKWELWGYYLYYNGVRKQIIPNLSIFLRIL